MYFDKARILAQFVPISVGHIVKSVAGSGKEGHLNLVVTAAPKEPTTVSLPQEFTLRLGPKSTEQVAALARILKDLGARVEVESDGALVAMRP